MFVLKEGVDYKVKITFKVRVAVMGDACQLKVSPPEGPLTPSVPQVNKEIVSGLKCLHHTYRQGLRGEGGKAGPAQGRGGGGGGCGEGEVGQRVAPDSLPLPQWTRPCTWWAVTARAPRSMSL